MKKQSEKREESNEKMKREVEIRMKNTMLTEDHDSIKEIRA